MNNREKEFKNRLIPDLETAGLNVLDLKSGVLDLFIDSGKRLFVELKIANMHYKKRANKKGINLSTQTAILKKMANLPIVLACDDENIDRCYFVSPELLEKYKDKRISQKRQNGKPFDVRIGVDHLEDDGCMCNYIEMIRKVKNYVLS